MRETKASSGTGNVIPFRQLSDDLILATRLQRIIVARRVRQQFLPSSLLTGPSWEMLLEAYLAYLEQRRISVSALCDTAEVARTTSLRWLRKLEDENMLVRQPDPLDRRRIWIELSPCGISAMSRYFDAVASSMPI